MCFSDNKTKDLKTNEITRNFATSKFWPSAESTTTSAITTIHQFFKPNKNDQNIPAFKKSNNTKNKTIVNFRSNSTQFVVPQQNSFGNNVNLDYRNIKDQLKRSQTHTFINSLLLAKSSKIKQQGTIPSLNQKKLCNPNSISTPLIYSTNTNNYDKHENRINLSYNNKDILSSQINLINTCNLQKAKDGNYKIIKFFFFFNNFLFFNLLICCCFYIRFYTF